MGRPDTRQSRKNKDIEMKQWLKVGHMMERAKSVLLSKINDKDYELPGFNLEKPDLLLPCIFYPFFEFSPNACTTAVNQAIMDELSNNHFSGNVKFKYNDIKPEYRDVLTINPFSGGAGLSSGIWYLASIKDERKAKESLARIATDIITSKHFYESVANAMTVGNGPGIAQTITLVHFMHWANKVSDNAYDTALRANKNMHEYLEIYLDSYMFKDKLNEKLAKVESKYSDEERAFFPFYSSFLDYLAGDLTELEFSFKALSITRELDDSSMDIWDKVDGEDLEYTKTMNEEIRQYYSPLPDETCQDMLKRLEFSKLLVADSFVYKLSDLYYYLLHPNKLKTQVVQLEAQVNDLSTKAENYRSLYKSEQKCKKSLQDQLKSANKDLDKLRSRVKRLGESDLCIELSKQAEESAKREERLISKLSDLDAALHSERQRRKDESDRADSAEQSLREANRLNEALEEQLNQLSLRSDMIDMSLPIEIVLNYIKTKRILLAGGIDEMQSRLSELGIQVKQYTFNRKVELEALRNSDCLVVMISNIKHTSFFAYRDAAKKMGKDIIYFRGQNVEQLCREIYHELTKTS